MIENTSAVVEKVSTTQKILAAMKQNPFVTIAYLCGLCKLTRDGLNWNIRKLKSKGLIRHVGPDKGGHWEVISQNFD